MANLVSTNFEQNTLGIYRWLDAIDEISNKFDDYQFGAVKGRSTTHELVHILHNCH